MKTFKEMLKISENEQILIDDKSKKVTFSSRVAVLKDELVYNKKTKSAVYVISEALKKCENLTLKLCYDKLSSNYEIYFDGVVCVNKTAEEVINDINYALNLLKQNVKTVYFCLIDYNESGTYFYDACAKMSIEKILETNALRSFKSTVKERVTLMKQSNEFNKKLKTIKQFDFRFGNSFGGIKKLGIYFNDGVLVKSNSGKPLNFEPNKEEILKELELFCFLAWKSKYDENKKPIIENAWTITIKLDGEDLEFSGLDDYPKNWNFVEYFVKKYGGFSEIRE